MTLTEFLLARIAEDETFAGRCDCYNGPGWTGLTSGAHVPLCPARVLAECESKRRIVGEHPNAADSYSMRMGGPGYCGTCMVDDVEAESFPCPTLRALALPYADHPDYQQEWRT